MLRVFGLLTLALVAPTKTRWWESVPDEPPEVPEFVEPSLRYVDWIFNKTYRFTGYRFDKFEGYASPTAWDGWIWMALDILFSGLGWLIFGKSWNQVRLGCSLLFKLSLVFGVCIIFHYVFALCWPILSLFMGLVLTMVWILRTTMKLFGRVAFYTQRLCGRVPEAADAVFFGPDTGEVPETAALRRLKKGNDGDRWLLVGRDGQTALFRVADSTSIKSSVIGAICQPRDGDLERRRSSGIVVEEPRQSASLPELFLC